MKLRILHNMLFDYTTQYWTRCTLYNQIISTLDTKFHPIARHMHVSYSAYACIIVLIVQLLHIVFLVPFFYTCAFGWLYHRQCSLQQYYLPS